MKVLTNNILIACIFLMVVSCNKKAIIPDAPDYSKSEYWFGDVKKQGDKLIDIFYVYPALDFADVNFKGDTMLYTDISLKEERNKAFNNQQMNKMVFASNKYNFYSPYYRQIMINTYLKGDSSQINKLSSISYDDIRNAFNYYMKHYNNGRPFILLGHSEGTMLLIRLLENNMTDEQFERMIAAYMIGYYITDAELQKYPKRIIPAQDSSDIHCIILFNSATTIKGISPILNHSAICINPLNWTTSSTLAPKNMHKGAAIYDIQTMTYTLKQNMTSAYIYNNYLICNDIDPTSAYNENTKHIFPYGNLHFMDSWLFAGNIQENMDCRVRSYMIQK